MVQMVHLDVTYSVTGYDKTICDFFLISSKNESSPFVFCIGIWKTNLATRETCSNMGCVFKAIA